MGAHTPLLAALRRKMNLLTYISGLLDHGFDPKINLAHALGNSAGAVLCLLMSGFTTAPILVVGAITGFFSGSINDIVGFARNQNAIKSAIDIGAK